MRQRRKDENLREVLEALTRLRLSHDRQCVRRKEALLAEQRTAEQERLSAASGPGLYEVAGDATGQPVASDSPHPHTRSHPFYSVDARSAPTVGEPEAGRDSLAGWSSLGVNTNPEPSTKQPLPWDTPLTGTGATDDAPWLAEAGGEPDLAGLVGAEAVFGVNAHGKRGEYLRRDIEVETRLPHLRGLAHALTEAMPETAALTGMVRDIDLLAEARPENLVFLDLETTGLHRGIIVLLGYMTMGPGDRPLTVTQLFPRDYGEEAYMLGEFMEVLRGDPVLVTFNGRSFDAPYFENRLRFHGWFEPLRFAHVDLLHLARRLWKGRLPNFRLQTLERRLFGRKRLDDLPGSEVPRVWEDFVNYGELRHLPGIWEHNLRDLSTLAEIIVRAARDARLCGTSDED
ncbi:MAG: ribonuclease H-like domain-containing protein [bacterium]|nr:ribonuclease H-like domain-containing protein [bacterium]